MNIEIKEISDGDLEECAEVLRQGFSTVAKDFGLTMDNCPTNGAFIKTERLIADKDKGNYMFGLYSNHKLAGFMQLEQKSDGLFFLEKLAILPDYRHNGYGKILLDFAKVKVREMKGTTISISIIEENTVLKNWYSSYGFIHTGTRKFEHLPFTVGFMELHVNNG